MPRLAGCACGGQMAVHHQLGHLTRIQLHEETQVRLLPARVENLHHRGEIHGGEQKMVRVEHIRVFAEQHAFDSLGDHADARLVQGARRLGRCVPPRKRHARDRGHQQTLLVGPAGNALSQRGERHVHAVLLTRLLDGLLTHSYLLSHITRPRVAGQPMIAEFGRLGKKSAGLVYRPGGVPGYDRIIHTPTGTGSQPDLHPCLG